MARVTYVKSARGKKNGAKMTCHNCRREIKPGDAYKWFANRIGRSSIRKNYCSTCHIRQSDMTTSPHLQTIYAGQEAADDALDGLDGRGTLDSLSAIMRDCAEAYREAQASYEESADNIEEGFGHETYQSEEIREKAQACESAADELESAADEVENMDDPDLSDEELKEDFDYEGETDENDEPVDKDDYDRELHEWAEEQRDDRWDAAVEQARDGISEGVQI